MSQSSMEGAAMESVNDTYAAVPALWGLIISTHIGIFLPMTQSPASIGVGYRFASFSPSGSVPPVQVFSQFFCLVYAELSKKGTVF